MFGNCGSHVIILEEEDPYCDLPRRRDVIQSDLLKFDASAEVSVDFHLHMILVDC